MWVMDQENIRQNQKPEPAKKKKRMVTIDAKTKEHDPSLMTLGGHVFPHVLSLTKEGQQDQYKQDPETSLFGGGQPAMPNLFQQSENLHWEIYNRNTFGSAEFQDRAAMRIRHFQRLDHFFQWPLLIFLCEQLCVTPTQEKMISWLDLGAELLCWRNNYTRPPWFIQKHPVHLSCRKSSLVLSFDQHSPREVNCGNVWDLVIESGHQALVVIWQLGLLSNNVRLIVKHPPHLSKTKQP